MGADVENSIAAVASLSRKRQRWARTLVTFRVYLFSPDGGNRSAGIAFWKDAAATAASTVSVQPAEEGGSLMLMKRIHARRQRGRTE